MESKTNISPNALKRPRKSLRLHNYDYSNPGLYFVTISTLKHQHLLGVISEGENGQPCMQYTKAGSCVEQLLYSLPFRNVGAYVEKAVVMPNHVHILFALEETKNKLATLTRVVQYYKSQVAQQTGPIWQRAYYDHIIRNEADLERVWTYIDQNPSRWLHGASVPGDTEVAPT